MTILRPSKKDPRDRSYHFHILFGAVSSFDPSCNQDPGKTMPNQIADSRPELCTAYLTTDIGFDLDAVAYSHDFQMMKTLQAMGTTDPSKGADARTAFSIDPTVGFLQTTLQPADMPSQNQAYACLPENWPNSLDTQTVREGAYIPVGKVPGMDWFDSIRSVIAQGHTVGMATQWSMNFEDATSMSPVLPDKPTGLYWGHAYKAAGWITRDGNPYLRIKSWQGLNYGDKGWVYMSRSLCNSLMGSLGTFAATLSKQPISPAETRIAYIQTLLAFMENLLTAFLYKTGII